MTAYELGRIIGTLFILIVVPALLVIWAIRLRRRGSRVWWIPAVVAALLFLLGIAARAQQAARVTQAASRIIAVNPEAAFPTGLPYRFEPIRDREFSTRIERAIKQEAPFATVAARLVTHQDEPIGLVVAFTTPRDAFVGDEFMEGVARGISQKGGRPPERVTIAGRPVLQFEAADSGGVAHGVVWHRPGTNLLTSVVTATVDDSRSVASAMIRSEGA